MSEARQYHLAKIMHPDHGDLGVFVRAFMDYVRKADEVQQSLNRFATRIEEKRPTTEENDYLSFIVGAFRREARNKERISYRHYTRRNIKYTHSRSVVWATHIALSEVNENSSREKGLLEKLPQAQDYDTKLSNHLFRERAGLIYNQGLVFTNSPRTIIRETLITMHQAMHWLCMYCETAQDFLDQMQASLEPTIEDPRNGKMISPIETLGYGNNGYIGEFIAGSFPMYINGEPIIRNASADDRSIICDAFVENWFDRELDIGGCPVLAQKSRMNDLYMEFSRFFVETAERINMAYQEQKPEIEKTDISPD
ncbi:MAG: hypothetical protein ACLFR0_04045 [Alphaproteobacteria bacterium]